MVNFNQLYTSYKTKRAAKKRAEQARQIAYDLVTTNNDFKSWSVDELISAIIDTEHEYYIDKSCRKK